MMVPVWKRAIQNMLRFGNDVLINIAYMIYFGYFSVFNLPFSYYKARYPM